MKVRFLSALFFSAVLLFVPFVVLKAEVNIDNFIPPSDYNASQNMGEVANTDWARWHGNCETASNFFCGNTIPAHLTGVYRQLYQVNVNTGQYTCLLRSVATQRVLYKYNLRNPNCTKQVTSSAADSYANQAQEIVKSAKQEALSLGSDIKQQENVIDLSKFIIALLTLDSSIIDFQSTLSGDSVTLKSPYSFANIGATTATGSEITNESTTSYTQAMFKSGNIYIDFMIRAWILFGQIAFGVFTLVLFGGLLQKGVEYGANYAATFHQEQKRFDDGRDENIPLKVAMGVFIFTFFYLSPPNPINKDGEELNARDTYFMSAFREGLYFLFEASNNLNYHYTDALVASNFDYMAKSSGSAIISVDQELNSINQKLSLLSSLYTECVATWQDQSAWQGATKSTDFNQDGENPYFYNITQENQLFPQSKYMCSKISEEYHALSKKQQEVTKRYETLKNQITGTTVISGDGGGLMSQGEKGILASQIMYQNAIDLGFISAAINPSIKMFFQTISDTKSDEETVSAATSNSIFFGTMFSNFPYLMLPGFDSIKSVGCQAAHAGQGLFSMGASLFPPTQILAKLGKEAVKDAAGSIIPGLGDNPEKEAAQKNVEALCSGYVSSVEQTAGTFFAFFMIKSIIDYLPIFTILIVGSLYIFMAYIGVLRYLITSLFTIVWIFSNNSKEKVINFFSDGIGVALRFPLIVFSMFIAYWFVDFYQNFAHVVFGSELIALQKINEQDWEWSWDFLFSGASLEWIQSIFRGWMLYFVEGVLGIAVALISIFGAIKLVTTTSEYIIDHLGYKSNKRDETDLSDDLQNRSERFQNPF